MYRKVPEPRAGDTTAYLKMICTSPFDISMMSSLLERMQDRLREEGATKLVYSNFASWHLLPGVDLRYENLLQFLLDEGFMKHEECVDYVIDLSAFRVPRRVGKAEEDLIREGIVVRLATPEDRDRVRDWVLKNSGHNWSHETAKAIGPAGSGVWIAEDETGLVAYSVFGSLEHHWFGPIGVAPNLRKKGLGTLLLFKSLDSMRQLGVPRAVIPWTGHLFFYSQVPGIVGLRHYWMMSKDL
jgi:GNAT superfamily N-acetyltransferase